MQWALDEIHNDEEDSVEREAEEFRDMIERRQTEEAIRRLYSEHDTMMMEREEDDDECDDMCNYDELVESFNSIVKVLESSCSSVFSSIRKDDDIIQSLSMEEIKKMKDNLIDVMKMVRAVHIMKSDVAYPIRRFSSHIKKLEDRYLFAKSAVETLSKDLDNRERDVLMYRNIIENLDIEKVTMRSEDICYICMEEIDIGERRIKFTCGHYLHLQCFLDCPNMKECGLCRKIILE